MPCFCIAPTQSFINLQPRISFAIAPPPMPMMNLRAALAMGVGDPAERADFRLSAAMTAAMGGHPLPAFRASAALNVMAQLSVAARIMPLSPLDMILAHIQQALESLKAQMGPTLPFYMGLPRVPMMNLVAAARLTLALRAQGICPFALAGLSEDVALGEASKARMNSAMHTAASLRLRPGLPFALDPIQLALAHQFAAIANVSETAPAMGLPPVTSPNFMQMLQNMLMGLAKLAMPPIDFSNMLPLAMKLDDIATINEAFGEMTPAQMSRINAMLRFMARLNIPMPDLALALSANLANLPPAAAVASGANLYASARPTFNAMMRMQMPRMPILPLLMALGVLAALLFKALGLTPAANCPGCKFPI